MNLKFLPLLLTLLLFTPNAPGQTEDNNNEWYPFVLSGRLAPDSPANIGRLVLDSPAGKHGFCKVRNGHFYFEDGTRAKFWVLLH